MAIQQGYAIFCNEKDASKDFNFQHQDNLENSTNAYEKR